MQEHILIWNCATLKVMDVRHIRIQTGTKARPYLLPSSAFLYVTHGSATVSLDGKEHHAGRFYMLHGGKGTCLEISLTGDSFHYYLIFYKASLPLATGRHSPRYSDQQLPFHHQYGFVPLHPAILYELAERMQNEWRIQERLQQLHVKTLFYQFVYELLRQMDQQQVSIARPNLASQIIRYMQEHYAEPVTREALAGIFHYSVPYLSKHFRRETGKSIIDYLISIRMDNAGRLLQQSDLTLQEIAVSVGYADVSYFIRMFKKVTGVTPKQFKEASGQPAAGSHRPINRHRSSIVPLRLRHYIDIRDDNHYQYSQKGELPMYRSKLPLAVTLLLCLTLLLSACSRPGNINGGTTTGTASNPAVGTESNTGNTAPGNITAGPELVTYSAVNGDVQIPKNPQRIVMVAGAFTGHLLALGLKPVGTGDESFNSYTEGKLDDVVNIGNDVPYEQIIGLQPDLIVVWNDPETIEKLSKIAPTVAVEYGIPLREQLTDFGKMTGREEQAKAWIAEWDAKIAKYKPLVEQAVGDRTVSIFDSGSAKEFYAYGSFGRGGDIIYGEFGLKAPPIIQKEAIDSGQGWTKLSLELLPQYAGDYIFISGWTGDENAASIFEGSLWDNLPAVKNNHVYRENSRGFVFSDPVSLEAQLQFVVDSLTATP
ncbi:AraC family transcriptional regulator [Paenibacillus sp. MMS20-IR301]|uniref:AraC family transcriptional regulator n=1 Tax=Paenibacillus sp. MMS20-IR301 TaxID=2895946 RepID=UPI0028E4D1F9|nr:AraC family transcriptional regulator [Paenibacillus sp. MMS20-IR301]WNS45567.1 AraC family transcriptional regulator [Paenibacillus sp. MMS20-IR301]